MDSSSWLSKILKSKTEIFKQTVNFVEVKESSPHKLIYYSEILIECIKSNKIKWNENNIGQKNMAITLLCDNIYYILNNPDFRSPGVVKSLGNSCLGLHLFFKSSDCNSAGIEIRRIIVMIDMLINFVNREFVPRDIFVLIMPFVICFRIEHQHLSVIKEIDSATELLKTAYNLGNWYGYILKLYNVKDLNTITRLADFSISRLSDTETCYHYIFLDLLQSCLRALEMFHRASDISSLVTRVFNITIAFTDERGSNTMTLSEKIQLTCIKLYPPLLETVNRLKDGPWYSRNTIIYTTLWVSLSNDIVSELVSTLLSKLVKSLGYNRIDHTLTRTIKSLLSKFLTSANFLKLLKICLDAVDDKPCLSRLFAVYICPNFNNSKAVPANFDQELVKLVAVSSDDVKIVLFYSFYQRLGDSLSDLLFESNLNKSQVSGTQSLLITLLTKNKSHCTDSKYLIATYQHILTIPCPSVRQHTLASFQYLIPLLKTSPQFYHNITTIFLDQVNGHAPFHAKLLALGFFVYLSKQSIVEKDLQSRLLKCIQSMGNQEDHEVQNLVEKCIILTSKSESTTLSMFCNGEDIGHLTMRFYNVTKLLTDQPANLIKHDISDLIGKITPHISNCSGSKLLELCKISLELNDCLLNMISGKIENGVYVAPSFEETVEFLESSIGEVSEDVSENFGKCVWVSLSAVLGILFPIGQNILIWSMNLFLADKDYNDCFVALNEIGNTCLQSIFRSRHRSVINAASSTLKMLTRAVSVHPTAHTLPKTWTSVLLSTLVTPSCSSHSRKSAGLPEAIESVLQCVDIKLTQDTVQSLVDTAKGPCVELPENTDIPQVHALHMLRLILVSAKLRLHMAPFTAQICELCYKGFVHSRWVIRNASLMLFSELVNFILGHINTEFTEDGYRSNISLIEIKQFYPGIYQQMILNLQENSNGDMISGVLTNPSVYLSLTLLSKIYPGICSDEDYAELLSTYLSSRMGSIRRVAARTLILACHPTTLHNFLHNIFTNIGAMNNNTVNGCLKFMTEYVKSVDNIERSLLENILSIDSNIMIHRNKALFIQILNVAIDKLVLTERETLFELIKNRLTSCRFEYAEPLCSELLDQLVVVYMKLEMYSDALSLIRKHHSKLSDTFWDTIPLRFHASLTHPDIMWFFDQITSPSSRYSCESLKKVLFDALNYSTSPKLNISDTHLNILAQNTHKHLPLIALLSISFGVQIINEHLLCDLIESKQSFNISNSKQLVQCYQISDLRFRNPVLQSLLTTALLHTQAEEDHLKFGAISFCMRFCNGTNKRDTTNIRTCLAIIESVVSVIKRKYPAGFCQDQFKKLCNKVSANESVLCTNAHFDKRLLVENLYVVNKSRRGS